MKAVFSAVQLGHKPVRYLSTGKMVHFPETPERARRLLQGVRKAGASLHAARKFDDSLLRTVHNGQYLKFLAEGYEEWIEQENAFEEMMASIRPVSGATKYPRHILGRAGFHQMDFSCPIVADTWKVVRASADTAMTAARFVADGERAAYALCRPPGHHADTRRASGFCYLNNTALAASVLRETHDRVAIVDIDVHHGNGTQEIFLRRADVLTVSIHADPAEFYPFYKGYAEEVGRNEGEGFNLNIPLPVRAGADQWLPALDTALERVAKFNPGALVVALGLDTHSADPLKGGGLETDDYGLMAQKIASTGLPVVIVQEGGYLTPYLGDNLASFLSAL